MKRLIALGLMALSACGTPQEQCIRSVSRDMNVLDRLIAESRGNIQRGYAWETVQVTRTTWVDCTPRPTEANPEPKSQMCLDDVIDEQRQPKAIDLDAEGAKLASMERRRAEMARAMSPAIEACKTRYPE